MSAPLMPKATAVWLVDNTALTFRQIADFCQLHELEVKGIADGDVAQGIKGLDPVAAGQLSREELDKGQADPGYRLKMSHSKVQIPVTRGRKGPRYTPVSRRQDRPDAIAWLLRYHPELSDGQIMKLVGTTKPTIQAIRDRTHWNSTNIKPVDPVSLSLCTQLDLDLAVRKAARKAAKMGTPVEPRPVETLLPASETTAAEDTAPELVPGAAASGEAAADDAVRADDTELTEADLFKTPSEPAAPDGETVADGQTGADEPELTEADVFKNFEQAPAEPASEEEDVDADSVFAKLKELKPVLEEEQASEPEEK